MMRRAHTKSRTGCRTCKTRRIRCDETWPSCKRCMSTGRRCDGPSTQTRSVPVSFAQISMPTPALKMRVTQYPWGESEQDTRYVQYFVTCVSQDLSSDADWRPLMLQAVQQETAVRRCAIALSALIQERVNHGSLEIHGFAALRSGRYVFALKKYGRALLSLRELVEDAKEDRQSAQATLLCGIICIWFEILTRDYLAGLSHLERCLKIVLDTTRFGGNIDPDIRRAYIRMDMQAALYIGMRAPATAAVVEAAPPLPYIFHTLPQAETSLMEEYVRVIHFARSSASVYRVHQPGWVPLELIAYTHALQERLALWKSAFRYSYSCQKAQGNPQTSTRVSLLLIQYHVALITASTCLYAEETVYDQFLYAFQRIIALAKSIASCQKDAAPGLVGVPVDMGTIYPLYFVATKCRDSLIRREAIHLLSAIPYPDGVWEAPILALVAQRAKEIEEIGFAESEPISEYKRVHGLGLDIDHDARRVQVEFRRRSNGMDGEWEEWKEWLSW